MASGTALTKNGKAIIDVQDKEFKDKVYSMNEIEQYDFFKSEAFKYIYANPIRFIKNTVKKFIYFWYFSPQTGIFYPPSWYLLYKIFYFITAALFIAGTIALISERNIVDISPVIFIIAFSLMVSSVHSLYYVEMRHRWMLEPLLLIISAYGITSLLKKVNICHKI